MKLPTLSLLPLVVSSTEIITKQINQPFDDDPSISILSPLSNNDALHYRRLQDNDLNPQNNSNDFRLEIFNDDATDVFQQAIEEPTASCSSSNEALWSLSIVTDNNPTETKWNLKRVSNNEQMAYGPPEGRSYLPNTSYDETVCILKGYKYMFRIQDSGGDGMCCDQGQGGFTMSVDGTVFIDRQGREEDWKTKSFLFHVGNLTEGLQSTPNPTRRPTPMPITPQPTPQPTEVVVTPNPTELFVYTPNPTDAVFIPNPTDPPVTPDPTASPTVNPDEGAVVSFIMMADTPYYTNHKYCLNAQLRNLNPYYMDNTFQFIVHLGDIKSGQTRDCISDYYTDVAEIFASPLNNFYYDTRDVFFLVGDNEWCDCQDPGSAFSYWMNSFGNGKKYNWINQGPNPDGFGTFSDANMRQTLQYDKDGSDSSSSYYESSATNFAFFINKVLFVGINQVGGADLGDESTRVRNNYQWVKNQMEKYASQEIRTLVVFAHASMTGSRWEYFGRPFQALLRDEYPDILVLYTHGDDHEFNLNRIDRYNPNLYSMVLDSGDLADPLLISITRKAGKRDGLNVDRRGGEYENGDCNPGNRDKTWSSSMF